MELELVPPVGLGDLHVGDPMDRAVEVMRSWGDVAEVEGTSSRMRVQNGSTGLDVFVHLDSSYVVEAIEIWRPEPEQESDLMRVSFFGIDVFSTPASEVLEALRNRGILLDVDDAFYPVCPNLVVGFNREGSEERDPDDPRLSKFFESVLVAAPGYY